MAEYSNAVQQLEGLVTSYKSLVTIVNDISFQTDLYTTSYIEFQKGDFNE